MFIIFINNSDYREKLHLDHYEVESADGEEYGNLDRDTRLLAEAKMRRRDREAGRIPDAFLDEGMQYMSHMSDRVWILISPVLFCNLEEDELEENLKLRRRRKDEFDVDIDLAADEVVHSYLYHSHSFVSSWDYHLLASS